jgi:hypothetical protein
LNAARRVTSNVAEDRAVTPANRGGEGVRLTVDMNRLYLFDADGNTIR